VTGIEKQIEPSPSKAHAFRPAFARAVRLRFCGSVTILCVMLCFIYLKRLSFVFDFYSLYPKAEYKKLNTHPIHYTNKS